MKEFEPDRSMRVPKSTFSAIDSRAGYPSSGGGGSASRSTPRAAQVASADYELSQAIVVAYGGFTALFVVSAIITHYWYSTLAPLYSVAAVFGIVAIVERVRGVRRQRELDQKDFELEELNRRPARPELFQVVCGEMESQSKNGDTHSAVVTIMKTDLRGYSGVCENLDGPRLLDWLTCYVDAVEEVITGHGGMVKSFEGDALHAVFGLVQKSAGRAVDHRASALFCALALRGRLIQLNTRLVRENMPVTATRVGINTGEVILGTLGSRTHVQYDAIGDAVNTAARLETFDKESMPDDEICRIQAGASTLEPVKDQFAYEYIGSVELRGKSERVDTYRITGARMEQREREFIST